MLYVEVKHVWCHLLLFILPSSRIIDFYHYQVIDSHMKLFPQETVLEIKTLLLMTDLAYCGYSYICMRRAFGEQYAFLFLLAIMVPRICQLSTRSIRCCCIFRAWVTVLRTLLTLWGLFCYRFFSEGFNKRLYFIYIVHKFS